MWCEFLKPQDVCKDFVINLFKKYNVALNFKLEYMSFTDDLFEMIRIYNQNGIPVSIWAVLSDELGYWINEANVDTFGDYVHKLVDIIDLKGLKIYGLCIDMEPPYPLVKKLTNPGSIFDKLIFYITLLTKNLNAGRYSYSKHKFTEIAQFLKIKGLESYVPVVRELYNDVLSGTDMIQNALETPVFDIPWDKYNFMYYATMIRKQIRKYNKGDVDYMVLRQVELLKERFKDNLSISAGVTNTGKLGNEPYYDNMDDFYRDIGVLKTCGVNDISIFSLDGILDPEKLEMFLKGVYEAKPYTPETSIKIINDEKKRLRFMSIAKKYYKFFKD